MNSALSFAGASFAASRLRVIQDQIINNEKPGDGYDRVDSAVATITGIPTIAPGPAQAIVFTGVTLLPVAALTLVPIDREVFERCEIAWLLPTPARVELFGNLVLFVAPALLVALATRRPAVTFIAACLLSAGIETLQAMVPAMGRSCDTTDWLSNSTGAAIGVVLALLAMALATRRNVARRHAPE